MWFTHIHDKHVLHSGWLYITSSLAIFLGRCGSLIVREEQSSFSAGGSVTQRRWQGDNVALFPGLPRFFVLRFASSLTHESKRVVKNWRRSGNNYYVNNARWTRGGCREEGSTFKYNILDFIIKRSFIRQDLRRSQHREYSAWQVRNLLTGLLYTYW